MKKLLKKIASRILHQEIEAMNKDLYRLKQQVYGQKKITLPQGAVSCIVDMLPNPNDVAMGRLTADQLLALNAPKNVRKYHYVLNGEERCSEIRIVADDRKEKYGKGLMIELIDFKLKVFIPLTFNESKFNGSEIKYYTWVWDFYHAGIRVIGDRNFQVITEFLSASARVLS